ncbi:MAG: cytosine permease [Desulfobacterales bacterium]|nr:cytosine permease [Desulfobacterales bacterium]
MDIRPVAAAERNLDGRDFFWLWAGVAISLAEIWAGGFLAPLGFWAGAFGIRGSNLAAVLNIVQLIGWAAIMLIIGGRAGAMLGKGAGGILATDGFWVVAIGLLTLLWALLTGRAVWKLLQTVSVLALFAVIAMMTWVAFTGLEPTPAAPAAAPLAFMTGLDLVIAMPISWMPLVADYARSARSTRAAFWNTWWGYFIVSSWMYLLGLQVALLTGASDPGQAVLEIMGRVGWAIPALAMVVLSTITSDFPDVYSATCSMLNISRRLSARTVMVAAGALAILVALVFPMEQYENFLFFIGAMFIPLFGVVLTDYFVLRGRRLDAGELYREGGAYWYRRGVNPAALAAWAAGFAVYQAIALLKLPVGGSIPAMLAAGLLYRVLSRKAGPPGI